MDINNLIIFEISFIILIVTIKCIKNNGIKTYNVFLFTFYLGVLLNTFKLGVYQQNKTFDDVYYLIICPFFFILPVYCAEKIKRIKIPRISKFTADFLFSVLFAVYILLKLYISKVVGWRISSLEYSTFLVGGDQYTLPGYSGLAISIQWILLLLTPYVKKRQSVCFIVALIIFSILHVKRGDILRMLMFYLIYFVNYSYYKKDFIKRVLKYGGIFLAFIIFIFVYTGNIRQEVRGDIDVSGTIIKDSGFKYNNASCAWLYSYYIINYDVLRLYYNDRPDFRPNSIVSTFIGEEDRGNYHNINGFNASTFMTTFIQDFGYLCIGELFLYGLILSFIVFIARCIQLDSLYIYICSIYAFSAFGNYFQARSIFVAIILFISLSVFIKKTDTDVKYSKS